MTTGVAVNAGDTITAAKMNLKQEDFTSIPSLTLLDNNGAGANQVTVQFNEVETANRTLNLKINNANRTIDLTGNLTLAANLTTAVAAITLNANVAGSNVTLPATGTLATLGEAETFSGVKTFSAIPIISATTLNFTAGAGFTLGTTDNQTLTVKTNAVDKFVFTTTLGQFTVKQAAFDWTLAFANPGAARTLTFADPGGADNVAYLSATQTLTNKTLTTASIGTLTVTASPINFTAGAGIVMGTTDNQSITIKTNAVNKFVFTTTLGQFTVNQATFNWTLAFSDPAAGRTLTFADPGGNDNVAYVSATQTLTNKTLTTASIGTLTVTGSPLNFTAGGAFVMGTTDNNTLAIKTNNTTRYTFAAATANVTVASAAVWTIPAATAAAYALYDGTTNMIVLDTRVAVDNIIGITLTGAPPTIASANGTTWTSVAIPAVTVTLTGGVLVTAMNGVSLNLARPTLTSAAATTVSTASTLYIANSPAAAGAGPVTITAAYALHVAAGTTLLQATNVAGTLTLTAATFNMTAGGAVTMGTTDANTLIIQTGGAARWTFAAASSNITAAGAADIIIQNATAAALRVSNVAGTFLFALDDRIAADNVEAIDITIPGISYASGAGSTYKVMNFNPFTITYTGGVGVTANHGLMLYLGQVTLAAGVATTVTDASTLYIAPPVQGANMTITNNRMITTSVAGCYLTAGGVWTDASSIQHKTDIERILPGDVLEKLKQLDVVTYRRKDPSDGGYRRYGLIAEDAPEYLANPSKDGIAASYMAGFALAAIKSLQQENDKLSKRIAELEQANKNFKG